MLVNFDINKYNPKPQVFLSRRIDINPEKLKDMVAKGMSYMEISNELGVSYATVHARCQELGLVAKRRQLKYEKFDPNRIKTLVAEGNSLSQIGRVLGVSIRTVRSILEHFGLKTHQAYLVSSIDKTRLLELIYDGKSQKEIARAFGIEDPGALTPLISKYKKGVTQAKVNKISKPQLIILLGEGCTVEEIAQRFAVAPIFIRELLVKCGLKPIKPNSRSQEISIDAVKECIEKGMTVKQIAKSLRVGVARIKKFLRSNNLKTVKQASRDVISEDRARAAAEGCKSYRQMASKLDIPVESARNLVRKYGITFEN